MHGHGGPPDAGESIGRAADSISAVSVLDGHIRSGTPLAPARFAYISNEGISSGVSRHHELAETLMRKAASAAIFVQ
jgi:hypothetical protein